MFGFAMEEAGDKIGNDNFHEMKAFFNFRYAPFYNGGKFITTATRFRDVLERDLDNSCRKTVLKGLNGGNRRSTKGEKYYRQPTKREKITTDMD